MEMKITLPYLANFNVQIEKNQHSITRQNSLKLQESPAVADKPARRKSMPKIAPIRRPYNVVADNTGLSSFV